MKTRGQPTDPCGTPHVSGVELDVVPLIFTYTGSDLKDTILTTSVHYHLHLNVGAYESKLDDPRCQNLKIYLLTYT